MSRPNVFIKAMRDQQWMILGFGVGSALMAALVLAIYPSYSEALEDFVLPPALQAIVGDVDIGTATGFVSVEFFSWIPVLFVVYAIIQGTGALAGEESSGTIDILLAQPISRTRLLVEKSLAIVVGAVAIAALALPGFVLPYYVMDIEVSLGGLLVATMAMVPLTLAFAALALLAGSVLPTRRDAASTLTAVAVVSYFINSLGQAADALDPLRPASLFYYYRADRILLEGVDIVGVIVLFSTAAVAATLAGIAFQRRDMGVVTSEGLLQRIREMVGRLRPLESP